MRSHPSPVVNGDRFHNQPETDIRPIVISRAKISTLRNARVLADRNLYQIVYPAILAEPGVITYRQQPRVLHPNTRLDYDAIPNVSAEQHQQKTANGRERKNRTPQQWQTNKEPSCLDQSR